MQYTIQRQPEKAQPQPLSYLAELTDDTAQNVNGGRWKEEKPETVPPLTDPGHGAGNWNPYDGNLLNHPEDDG